MKRTLIPVIALIILLLVPAVSQADGEYNEAPALAALVEAGQLPAVEDRLPVNPLVVKTDSIGQYGGTWRQAVQVDHYGHAWWHVNYTGNAMVSYNRERTAIVPNVAESYEMDSTGCVFTFKLRDGLRWSDGEPFTMEDILFSYNDILMNKEMYPVTPSLFQGSTLTVVDDLTFQLSFETPQPMFIGQMTSNGRYFIAPAHYLKQFHIDYADPDSLQEELNRSSQDNWFSLLADRYGNATNPDLPTLSPYVFTCDPAVTTNVTMERNPYYYAVDEAGNQLPYIDNIVIEKLESSDLVAMKVIAGEVDCEVATVMENFSNYSLFLSYAEENDYHIDLADFDEANALNFHVNACSLDPVKGPYLQSVDFRRALSLGLDREAIIATFYTVGPFSGTIAQSCAVPSSKYWTEEFQTQYTQFDKDAANAMLDALGMTTYDGNGFRMTANGEEFHLVVSVYNAEAQWLEVSEMMASMWRENLKLNITTNLTDPAAWISVTRDNLFDIACVTARPGWLVESLNCLQSFTGYTGYGLGNPYLAGAILYWDDPETENAFKPTEDMQTLYDNGEALTLEPNSAVREALIKEIIQINTDELYVLGICYRMPALEIISNKLHNATELIPDWNFGNCGTSRPDAYWFGE